MVSRLVRFGSFVGNILSLSARVAGAIHGLRLRGRVLHLPQHLFSPPFSSVSSNQTVKSNKIEAIQLPKAEVSGSNSNVKKANLFARRKESVKLPNYDDGCGGNLYPISAFLNHPSGVETILNKDALQSLQSLDSNTYRCTLQKIQLLNFEVAPVLDLRVTTTNEDCIVEMLSCKFEGSEAMECQNDHFSASMVNHMKWDASTSEPSLDVDVKLSITLEFCFVYHLQIYTRPFTLLPVSAVENPGNLIMQRLVDKLVSLLVERLLQDYDKWVQEQLEISP
ncbi:PREDICTED: uncharacterized protein LOC104612648 isoform X2 [Nelumbo nucifera]|uniref:Uncharacterized protein LOC104612648 isoform X2 n=1 Tax=Nelumbo nucifera TaxID=4432 RepID=A0A1U8BAU8_NELNU|nr:PREDICTED: uncharacterized protein LOC104612648 isoform X2 [Nelumbo nucifera]